MGTTRGQQVRVFLVDDHEVMRIGLREMINAWDNFTIVGEAESAEEAVRTVRDASPDLAIIDLKLPGLSGVSLCRELRTRLPTCRLLVFSSLLDEGDLRQARLAGADGYLDKAASPEQLRSAMRSVVRGGSTGPWLPEPDADGPSERERPDLDLSPQEHRIVDLVALGWTNREIAHDLHLSEKTVRNYVSRVLQRFGLRNRTELAALLAGGEGRTVEDR